MNSTRRKSATSRKEHWDLPQLLMKPPPSEAAGSWQAGSQDHITLSRGCNSGGAYTVCTWYSKAHLRSPIDISEWFWLQDGTGPSTQNCLSGANSIISISGNATTRGGAACLCSSPKFPLSDPSRWLLQLNHWWVFIEPGPQILLCIY